MQMLQFSLYYLWVIAMERIGVDIVLLKLSLTSYPKFKQDFSLD